MLANGTTLGYKVSKEGSTYTDLPGLKTIPNLANKKEKVENSPLTAKTKMYEFGVGDPGDMAYGFKYDNSSANSPYRVMRGYETSGTTLYFCETLYDGTKYEFAAQVSVEVTGGSLNSVIDFNLGIALQSEFTITDPAGTSS